MQVQGRIKAGGVAISYGKDCGVAFQIPATLNLESTAPTRKIEISTDGGKSWITPELDQSSAQNISVAIYAPITSVKFTGSVNDLWSVL